MVKVVLDSNLVKGEFEALTFEEIVTRYLAQRGAARGDIDLTRADARLLLRGLPAVRYMNSIPVSRRVGGGEEPLLGSVFLQHLLGGGESAFSRDTEINITEMRKAHEVDWAFLDSKGFAINYETLTRSRAETYTNEVFVNGCEDTLLRIILYAGGMVAGSVEFVPPASSLESLTYKCENKMAVVNRQLGLLCRNIASERKRKAAALAGDAGKALHVEYDLRTGTQNWIWDGSAETAADLAITLHPRIRAEYHLCHVPAEKVYNSLLAVMKSAAGV